MKKPILDSLTLLGFVFQITASPQPRTQKCIVEHAPNSLIANSPFLPPGYPSTQVTPGGGSNGPIIIPAVKEEKPKLAFKGYVRHQGVWKFSILDRKTGKTQWLQKGQLTGSGLLIKAFDPDTEVLDYTYKKTKGQLSLIGPKR